MKFICSPSLIRIPSGSSWRLDHLESPLSYQPSICLWALFSIFGTKVVSPLNQTRLSLSWPGIRPKVTQLSVLSSSVQAFWVHLCRYSTIRMMGASTLGLLCVYVFFSMLWWWLILYGPLLITCYFIVHYVHCSLITFTYFSLLGGGMCVFGSLGSPLDGDSSHNYWWYFFSWSDAWLEGCFLS